MLRRMRVQTLVLCFLCKAAVVCGFPLAPHDTGAGAGAGNSRSQEVFARKVANKGLALSTEPVEKESKVVLKKSEKQLESSQAQRAQASEVVEEAKAAVEREEPTKEEHPKTSPGEHHSTQFKSFAAASIHWPTYPYIAFGDGLLLTLLAKQEEVPWWADYKLWVGAFIILGIWAKRFFMKDDPDDFQHFIYQAFFVFGWNLECLHILQYAASGMAGISYVCCLLAAQSVVQTFITWKEDDILEDKKFTADTLYLDIGAPWIQIMFLGVAQVGAFWFYLTSIQGNYNSHHFSYIFWLWAFITMQMIMIFNRGKDSVLGFLYPTAQWYSMVGHINKLTFQLLDDDGEKTPKPFKLGKASIMVRGAAGFLTNTILRDIMAFTIPLMLSDFADPMNFLVYCVGVNFICSMDDMTEKVYSIKVDGEEEASTA